jgi:DNA-binding response OmpR family regulator
MLNAVGPQRRWGTEEMADSEATNDTVLLLANDIGEVRTAQSTLLDAGYRVSVQTNGGVDFSLNGISAAIIASRLDSQTERICEAIRHHAPTLPLFVLGPDDTTTKVRLLALGADDYIVEPFDAVEFLARIKSRIRRAMFHTR